MNEEKMIKVLARVEDEATLVARGVEGHIGFNMGHWYGASPLGAQHVGDGVRDLNYCGTTACLAGHAVFMEGYLVITNGELVEVAPNAYENIESKAREILGLGVEEDSNDMTNETPFYLSDLDEVYTWVADRMGLDEAVLREKVQAERSYK